MLQALWKKWPSAPPMKTPVREAQAGNVWVWQICVSLLGAFLNSHSKIQAEDLRPGWVTIRRSLMIAALEGNDIGSLKVERTHRTFVRIVGGVLL
jgi:hypothetical protein